jgi:hypothetical protein
LLINLTLIWHRELKPSPDAFSFGDAREETRAQTVRVLNIQRNHTALLAGWGSRLPAQPLACFWVLWERHTAPSFPCHTLLRSAQTTLSHQPALFHLLPLRTQVGTGREDGAQKALSRQQKSRSERRGPLKGRPQGKV